MNWQTINKIAKSYHYQQLYTRAKEIQGIHIFENTFNFSFIQSTFLQCLEMYHNLYQDLYSKEPFISEAVIQDDLRTEAYLLWKQQKTKKTPKKIVDSSQPGAVMFTKEVK